MSDNQSDNDERSKAVSTFPTSVVVNHLRSVVLHFLVSSGRSCTAVELRNELCRNDNERLAVNLAIIELLDKGEIVCTDDSYFMHVSQRTPKPAGVIFPPKFDNDWVKVLRQDALTGPVGDDPASKEAFHTRIGWLICAWDAIVYHHTGGHLGGPR